MSTVDTAALRALVAARDADGTGVVTVTTDDLTALLTCYEVAQSKPTVVLAEPQSIQRNPATNDLILGWWRVGNPSAGEDHTVDIARALITPEHLADFMQTLSREAWYAVDDMAKDYAQGDCDLCGNCRTVDVIKNGREWNVSCPNCGPCRGAPGFSNRPRIHRGTWDPTTPYDADTMKG